MFKLNYLIQKLYLLIFLAFGGMCGNIFAQSDTLKQRINQIIQSKQAEVGVAIFGTEPGDTLSINGNTSFPMQSVYKLHLAFAVLNSVDKGELNLNRKVTIRKSDFRPGTLSPLRDKYPNGNIELPLKDILVYTVAQSDNNGCDLLFRLIGGTKVVNDYMHGIGIKNIEIKATEQEMSREWNVQFTNWTSPLAAVQLLRKFEEGKILSEDSRAFLWETLLGTTTGNKRLKGDLPQGTPVAHKTGSSGKYKNGISAAVNDIGIVVLPNGKHFLISVFISKSKEDDQTNEKIIADISKMTWDYYIDKIKK